MDEILRALTISILAVFLGFSHERRGTRGFEPKTQTRTGAKTGQPENKPVALNAQNACFLTVWELVGPNRFKPSTPRLRGYLRYRRDFLTYEFVVKSKVKGLLS
jgi:hypothetical protein